MKELAKAFKNPVSNLGTVLEAASKRAVRRVGLGSAPSLQDKAHPSLAESAKLVSLEAYAKELSVVVRSIEIDRLC